MNTFARFAFRFSGASLAIAVAGCANSTAPAVTPAEAGIAAARIGPAAAAKNLIRDGSFETPVVPAGTYVNYNTEQLLGKWTVAGASGNVSLVSGTYTANGFDFPARCGQQWLDLTGTSKSATGVEQEVKTTAGDSYVLTFYVGNIYDPNGIFGVTSTVNVLVNGSEVFTATNNGGQGVTHTVWEKFATTFQAATRRTTITFINGDPSDDTMNGLDCVRLTAM